MELIILIAVVAVIVIVVIAVIAMYNALVRARLRVEEAWSQIDVQLKRRHDLVPNLVNAVRGYMEFEEETLTAVTNARANAVAAGARGPADQAQAESMLTETLRSLFAVAEAYPDLKANQNVLSLQEELTTTENRIAFARQHYNATTRDYNTMIASFPQAVIARQFGFSEREFFEAEPGAEVVPEVNLR